MVSDRENLLNRLCEDLIGPRKPDEVLASRPSDVYLTGILWPRDTPAGAEADDRLGVSGDADGGGAESGENDQTPPMMTRRPCTAGVSFAIEAGNAIPQLRVTVSFAKYVPEEQPEVEQAGAASERPDEAKLQGKTRKRKPKILWKRQRFDSKLELQAKSSTIRDSLPEGVEINIRAVPWGRAHLVTVTVVNAAQQDREAGRDDLETKTMFQVRLAVGAGAGSRIVARPSTTSEIDEDDRVASVIYRNAKEFATGHTASACWQTVENGATEVGITWVPRATVSSVSSDGHMVFANLKEALSADWLAQADAADTEKAVRGIAAAYGAWIELQRRKIATLPANLVKQAEANLGECTFVLRRMESGADLIRDDETAALAFRLANRAMAMQFGWDPERKKDGRKLVWRPFQLGFLLLSLSSTAERGHGDREIMDLLWFPTGGGKTEAYLALVAFASFYRRLRYREAGVTALMRYTLRLLTTQQFARASALVMACEALRRRTAAGVPASADLGDKPFSIGLWVGGDATPNNFDIAKAALSGDGSQPSPKQLSDCPACHSALRWSADVPSKSIHVRCSRETCLLHFGGDRLPIHTVDTDVYRERPTLLIGTIDKFAQIARKEETNGLFSIPEGQPPELIIQDELHLISGPLGTLAGIYESALDLMFEHDGRCAKIIGSTATIRRASDQVGALFDRATCQFPPPAIDHDDSGFAVADRSAPGRLYASVTTAGRSAKFALQAVSASLLQSAAAGIPDNNRRDPYWTLVAYFNSLRELGGALVLMQDDVSDAISLYSQSRAEQPRQVLAVEELTSRRTQKEVVDMLSMLKEAVSGGAALDAVLATNMLSVGVDIPRLGLMVVNGQPKGIAEYIQATSRVGRGKVPGLIVSVLNNAKARDRSRYETFPSWHQTLYRDVEATSVTPFAPRARDRALHAAVVSVVRHLVDGLLEQPRLDQSRKARVSALLDRLAERAKRIDPEESEVRNELSRIAKDWHDRAPKYYWNSFRPNQSLLQDAERAAAMRAQGREPGEAWPTMNNLRSVEPSTPFRMTNRLSTKDRRGGETPEEEHGDRW